MVSKPSALFSFMEHVHIDTQTCKNGFKSYDIFFLFFSLFYFPFHSIHVQTNTIMILSIAKTNRNRSSNLSHINTHSNTDIYKHGRTHITTYTYRQTHTHIHTYPLPPPTHIHKECTSHYYYYFTFSSIKASHCQVSLTRTSQDRLLTE